MISTSVREPIKVIEYRFRSIGFEKNIFGFVSRLDVWEFNSLAHPRLDCFDRCRVQISGARGPHSILSSIRWMFGR